MFENKKSPFAIREGRFNFLLSDLLLQKLFFHFDFTNVYSKITFRNFTKNFQIKAA